MCDTTYNKKTFIWNHRWEEDKNPKEFFQILEKVKASGEDFILIVCGKENNNPEFVKAKKIFKQEQKRMPLRSLTQHQIDLLDRMTNTESTQAYSVTHTKVTFQI